MKRLLAVLLLMTAMIHAEESLPDYGREFRDLGTLDKYMTLLQKSVLAQKNRWALDRCVWFYNNAEKIDPSYYPVRNGQLLQLWCRLAARYPAAWDEMASVRDEREARLRAGKGSNADFDDMMALSRELGEEDLVLELFRFLHKEYPTQAKQFWPMIRKKVFQAQNYELAQHYIKDPDAEFTLRLQRFRSSWPEATKASEADRKEFADDALELIAMAEFLKQDKVAANIRRQAYLAVDDNRLAPVVVPGSKRRR